LARGSASLAPNKDGPTIMDVATPAADKYDSTYKTPSKRDIPVSTAQHSHNPGQEIPVQGGAAGVGQSTTWSPSGAILAYARAQRYSLAG
jgi:hypothetical protein